jgi:hypothetical protein
VGLIADPGPSSWRPAECMSCLQRAARCRTNREIALELFVTVKTVEKHLASAYQKLGIEGRGELAGRSARPEIGRTASCAGGRRKP